MITTKSFFLISWGQKPILTVVLKPLCHTCPGDGGELSITNGDDDLRVVRPAPLVT